MHKHLCWLVLDAQAQIYKNKSQRVTIMWIQLDRCDIFDLLYSCLNIFKYVESLNLTLDQIKVYYAQSAYLKRNNGFDSQHMCKTLPPSRVSTFILSVGPLALANMVPMLGYATTSFQQIFLSPQIIISACGLNVIRQIMSSCIIASTCKTIRPIYTHSEESVSKPIFE